MDGDEGDNNQMDEMQEPLDEGMSAEQMGANLEEDMDAQFNGQEQFIDPQPQPEH